VTRSLPIAPDPAVPQLADLLDPSHVATSISRVLGVPVRRAVPLKVKYRLGEHVRIAYDVDAGEQRTIVAIRSLRRDRDVGSPDHRRLRTAPADASAFDLPDLQASAWAFPHDRRIAHIDALLSPRPALAGLLEHRWSSSRLAGYTPEKAVVVECLDSSGCTIAFAKQYASATEARDAFRVHRALSTACAAEGLRLPRALGMDAAAHVVVSEAAVGRRCTAPTLATNPDAMARLGRAVAGLHAIPPSTWMPRVRREGPETIRATVSLLGRAMPSSIDRLTCLAVRLAASRPPAGRDVTLHGDLHLKNVMADGRDMWLIDLDQSARGPAAADLGSFAALLRSHAATGVLDRETADHLENAFLDGYAALRRLPSVRTFEWHVAAAVLGERALRAVTRLRWPLLTNFDALLDEAFAALDKAGAR